MPSGEAVHAYDITNRRGTSLTVITLGAIITSLQVAGRDGERDDIVLGLDDVESYLTRSPYLGAVTGRYGNRIAGGRFTLDGVHYTLATNNPPNHLHGGVVGFDKRLYTARAVAGAEGAGVRMTLVSADGEEGYPGEVHFSVRYLLDDDDRLTIDYHATTTRATPFNPCQHSYFNLAGGAAADVLGHELQLHADRYTPVDATLIPTGALAPVDGTPFDFRHPTCIGSRIHDDDAQLSIGHGYDHNYVLRRVAGRERLVHAAQLRDPVSGRTLDVHTTEPGMQLYTGNFLDGSLVGPGGRTYGPHAGVCLETQHFPDSPNRPEFPSAILRPEKRFSSRTVFTFSAT
jgi:aldose 1-epimerase